MKRLNVVLIIKNCLVSMITTRFHFINTQLRQHRFFCAKNVCIKVVFTCILVYVVHSIIRQALTIDFVNVPFAKLRTGLKAEGSQFLLDGKPLTILSGAIHYFRVVPEYWEDRLLKLKALGLNTVETYVPWNLHEPTPGNYNFDGNADIKAYIELAQKLGLHVIVRPGPYICAEWEFGGLPSWLLRDPEIEIRSFSSSYLRAVDDYLSYLFSILVPLQYTRGGPIIAFQIENEYGNYGDSSYYMQYLYDLFTLRGVTELLFTSNGLDGARKALLPSVLTTINFQSKPEWNLQGLQEIQPDRPLMVMEFWPGWFDHWGEKHKVMQPEKVTGIVRKILKSGASINFYMFHGGTNFGFMNGGNHDDSGYLPTITSYDYDCPISEAGDITSKYLQLHELLKELRPELHTNTISEQLNLPVEIKKSSYGTVMMTKYIGFEEIVSLIEDSIESEHVMAIEDLPINNNAGQSYGYTLYRTTVSINSRSLNIEKLRDYGQIFIDRKTTGIVKWPKYNGKFNIDASIKGSKFRILDIFVENCGRVNYGKHIIVQKKGLRNTRVLKDLSLYRLCHPRDIIPPEDSPSEETGCSGILGSVTIDKVSHKGWKIVPFEFKSHFVAKLVQSEDIWIAESPGTILSQPALFKGTFVVSGKPADTFLNLQGWHKGVAFVNGHNLGRYWKIGPQKTLYVPAPWLKEGKNTVLIFEQHPGSSLRSVKFVNEHRLGPTVEHIP